MSVGLGECADISNVTCFVLFSLWKEDDDACPMSAPDPSQVVVLSTAVSMLQKLVYPALSVLSAFRWNETRPLHRPHSRPMTLVPIPKVVVHHLLSTFQAPDHQASVDMPHHAALGYEEEEDVFGDNDINPAQPLDLHPKPVPFASPVTQRPGPNEAGPSSAAPKYPISVDERRKVQDEVRGRMDELREKKRSGSRREVRAKGPSSLRECCMAGESGRGVIEIHADPRVVRYNAARIWDIGDMEYPIIRPFLDELPRDQLEEIERNSPVRLGR
jgi:hypothetical protein